MMEIIIIKEKNNTFFKRKELTLVLKHPAEATPSKAELTKVLAERHNVDISQIKIDYIFTKKGISESLAKVKILEERFTEAKDQKKEKKEGEKLETQTS
ncbi:MAG: hypothetical protein QXQ18_02445 [Candidatus Aenigmatarchaeota archaeon]